MGGWMRREKEAARAEKKRGHDTVAGSEWRGPREGYEAAYPAREEKETEALLRWFPPFAAWPEGMELQTLKDGDEPRPRFSYSAVRTALVRAFVAGRRSWDGEPLPEVNAGDRRKDPALRTAFDQVLSEAAEAHDDRAVDGSAERYEDALRELVRRARERFNDLEKGVTE